MLARLEASTCAYNGSASARRLVTRAVCARARARPGRRLLVSPGIRTDDAHDSPNKHARTTGTRLMVLSNENKYKSDSIPPDRRPRANAHAIWREAGTGESASGPHPMLDVAPAHHVRSEYRAVRP